MKKRYYNEAIIGNDNIVASFSKYGEMIRLFYPTRDYRQFVDVMQTGVKINDSALIYLHNDINNTYEQYYTENTNILNTEIKNTYFNVAILQTDFVTMGKDIIIKKYKITNENSIDLKIDFLVYSKLLTSFNNMVGTRVENDIFMQYSHNYAYCIFSKLPIKSYKLNNSQEEIKSGNLQKDKDYIAMAEDSALSYEIGNLAPGESKEFEIFIYINNNREIYKFNQIIENVKEIKQINVEKELKATKKYWEKYVQEHDGLQIAKNAEKWERLINPNQELNDITYNRFQNMLKIYNRSILLFPLLMNKETGGISAALEVDEEKDKCGRYSYCWPRDAVFVSKALDILKMSKETEKFYTVFSTNTQSENGMWEQRFYTDGRLAPCWGYQIDETASIVFGVYSHYYNTYGINMNIMSGNDNNKGNNKDKGNNTNLNGNNGDGKKFLQKTIKMCEKATQFLKSYIDFVINKENYKNENKELRRFETNESYDLWENNEGIHIYSLSSIYAAFEAMTYIYKELQMDKKEQIKKEIQTLKKYEKDIKEYCLRELVNTQTNTLKRNNKDDMMDISILGTVTPFRMLSPEQKEVKNTVQRMNLTIKTYTQGYVRYQNDGYMEGKNPWPVATLWMALYNIQIGNIEEAIKQLELITKTSTQHRTTSRANRKRNIKIKVGNRISLVACYVHNNAIQPSTKKRNKRSKAE